MHWQVRREKSKNIPDSIKTKEKEISQAKKHLVSFVSLKVQDVYYYYFSIFFIISVFGNETRFSVEAAHAMRKANGSLDFRLLICVLFYVVQTIKRRIEKPFLAYHSNPYLAWGQNITIHKIAMPFKQFD